MIIPNLMVSNMVRSFTFYRGLLGLSVEIAVSSNRQPLPDTDGSNVAFAILSASGGQLMLQTVDSLRGEHPGLPSRPGFTGTIYFRDLDPETIVGRADPDIIVKPVELQWYGMREAYLRDPDGYLVCIAAPGTPAKPA